MTYPPARLAALALRWAAQLATGEDTTVVSGCRIPLRDAGLNMDMMEFMARKWAGEAQAMIETIEDATSSHDA